MQFYPVHPITGPFSYATAGELGDVQSTVLSAAITEFLHCWAVSDYGNTSRSRGTAAMRINMTQLQ